MKRIEAIKRLCKAIYNKWRVKRCVDCTEWFSTYRKAFKGMDCHKPNAGHCTRNIFNHCTAKFEYYVRKNWKLWRPK